MSGKKKKNQKMSNTTIPLPTNTPTRRINTRKFSAHPGEYPLVFRPVIRSPSVDKIDISTPDMLKLYAPEKLITIFKSDDKRQIEQLCHDLCALLQSHETLHNVIVENDELVQTIVDFAPSIDTSEFMAVYTMLILLLLEQDDPTMIDAGILFSLRESLLTYPTQLLIFYNEIPPVSVYARNAMVCTGILADIIQYTKDNNSVEGARAIQTVFRCEERITNDDLEPLLPSIVSLLSMTNEKAVYYIVITIINILRQNHDFVSTFYDLKIHDYICNLLPIQSLTRCCVYMIGNLSICERAGIAHLIRTGTVQKLLELASTNKEVASGAFWALSNCVESSPGTVLPLIPVEFLKTTIDTYDTSEDKSTIKDCAFFLATLILFSPHEKFHIIVSDEILSRIIKTLHSDSDPLVIRCIDALARVLFVGITNDKMKYLIQMICSSEELSEHMNRLCAAPNSIISKKAKTMSSEIEKKKQELSAK